MSDSNLALRVSRILYNRKAQDILTLGISHLTVLADYLVIATGHNAIQVRALAEHIEEDLEKDGLVPRRVEGRSEGVWLVMDYGQVIIHLFRPEERAYYRLERLWEDGQNRLELPFVQDETA